MRFLVLLLALWFSPVSFANEHTEEEPSVAAVDRGTCPGGICRPRPRPRPRPSR